jgi:hypothetical protein
MLYPAQFARLIKKRKFLTMLLLALIVMGIASWGIMGKAHGKQVENPDPQFGIAAGSALEDMSPSSLNTYLQGVKTLGATWVRFDIDWSIVQQNGATTYNWLPFDNIVAGLNKYGLKGLGIIDYTPSWARLVGCSNSQCAPASPQLFANFSRAVVERYAPMGMHTWEIWNEPNLVQFWKPRPNPSLYSTLLQDAYLSIKAEDSSATVLVGGLSDTSTEHGNISMRDFLSALYNDHTKGFFDAVAVHPYTYPSPPSSTGSSNGWAQLSALHTIMASHGDGNKLIWITEYGAPTNGPGEMASSGTATPGGGVDHVSTQLQAKMVTDAVELYETYSWMGPFFWYSYQDVGISSTTNENFFGLVDANGNKKPAYYAYQQAIQSSK